MWKAWGLDGSFRPPGEPWIRMHRAQKNLPRRPRIIATPLCQGDSLAIRHLSTRPSAHAAAASLGWAWLNGGVFAALESYILPLTIWLRSKKLANGYCHLESHGTGQHCPSTSADIAQCFQFWPRLLCGLKFRGCNLLPSCYLGVWRRELLERGSQPCFSLQVSQHDITLAGTQLTVGQKLTQDSVCPCSS